MRSVSVRAAIAACTFAVGVAVAIAGVVGVAPPAVAAGTAAARGADAGTAVLPTEVAAAATEVAATVRAILAPAFAADWRGIEALRAVEWTPLPPKALQDCLPEGGCFVRQGTAHFGGRPFGALASGARDAVTHLHLHSAGEPVGEAAVLAALRRAGLALERACCPPETGTGAGTGSSSCYRVSGPGAAVGMVSVRSACEGRPCEGYTVARGTVPEARGLARDGGLCGATEGAAQSPATAPRVPAAARRTD